MPHLVHFFLVHTEIKGIRLVLTKKLGEKEDNAHEGKNKKKPWCRCTESSKSP